MSPLSATTSNRTPHVQRANNFLAVKTPVNAITKIAHGAHLDIAEQHYRMAQTSRAHEVRQQRNLLNSMNSRSSTIAIANLSCAVAMALFSSVSLGALLPGNSFFADYVTKISNGLNFSSKGVDFVLGYTTNLNQSENKADEIRLQALRERTSKFAEDCRETQRKLDQTLQDQHAAAMRIFQ